MVRLIDADALKLSHCKECSLYPDKCMGDDCDWGAIIHINAMPTIEAEPVRHGKWIPHEDEFGEHYGDECSECSEWYVMPYGKLSICPNCGARMDKE